MKEGGYLYVGWWCLWSQVLGIEVECLIQVLVFQIRSGGHWTVSKLYDNLFPKP